jgi:hypothetical protein
MGVLSLMPHTWKSTFCRVTGLLSEADTSMIEGADEVQPQKNSASKHHGMTLLNGPSKHFLLYVLADRTIAGKLPVGRECPATPVGPAETFPRFPVLPRCHFRSMLLE